MQLDSVPESSADKAECMVEETLLLGKGKTKQGSLDLSSASTDDNELVILLASEENIHQKAELMSLCTTQWLYNAAWNAIIALFSGIGLVDADERDEGFEEVFIEVMALLIQQQPAPHPWLELLLSNVMNQLSNIQFLILSNPVILSYLGLFQFLVLCTIL